MPDTIYALSSGQLPSGVAVIRLSGPAVSSVAMQLLGMIPPPRVAVKRSIRDRNNSVIDEGLILHFPGPFSFTGEDCLELQVHGSRAVVNKLLALLGDIDGLRLAEAGEFTRRAFENGKLDLLEVEGLSDLIVAETEMQRRLALEYSRGALSSFYSECATRLTRCRALIEAELDFADEADVPGSVSDQVWAEVSEIDSLLKQHLADAKQGERIRNGLKVVIAGQPNAGKSSLLNALARRDVAIVTDVAGTTRDILEVDLDINGFAVHLSDTAGLRESADIVEKEGIRRAREAFQSSDVLIALSEIDDFTFLDGLTVPERVLRVATKSDLAGVDARTADLSISTRTGLGIDKLLAALVADLEAVAIRNQLAIPSRLRHEMCLRDCVKAIEEALRPQPLLELRAEWLRQAALSLGRITGSVDVEDLLDVIFREFCVGK